MNKMKQYTKGLFFAAFAVAGLTLTSCKDQPDKYEVADGTPTVHYVRCLSSEIKNNNDAEGTHYTTGELVEEASPQSTICLVGDNLRSVYEIYFNDQKAVLNTSYITDNTLIVDVPKSVPVDVTDKIYMITKNGEKVDYDFHVAIPAPNIAQMSCEYASIGDKVKFTGDYYVNYEDSPLEVYFTDASGNLIPAEISTVADDYTSVEVIVPEGAVEGPISMTSIYGTSSSVFNYRDSRGMLFDFEDPSVGGTGLGRGGNAWHDRPIKIDENSIADHYIIIGDGKTAQKAEGGWDDKTYSFEYWCGDWNTPQSYPDYKGTRLYDLDHVDFSKPENLILKFEMCIPSSNPWKTGGLQMIFSSTKYVSLGGNSPDVYGDEVHPANNIYFRDKESMDSEDEYFKKNNLDELPRAIYKPWTSEDSFDTGGKWITVTIPIASSFIYGYKGKGLSFNLKETDFANFQMILVGGGEEASTPVFYIDNIRVIPNK